MPIMASRALGYLSSALNRVGSNRTFATSTAPRMKPFFPAAIQNLAYQHSRVNLTRQLKLEFMPVYVALGMIALSAALGLRTAMHQLLYAPNVFVRKTKRETVPEVVMPDEVAKKATQFIHKSVFRKIAHVQNTGEKAVPDPIRGSALTSEIKTETLKSVGVDPIN